MTQAPKDTALRDWLKEALVVGLKCHGEFGSFRAANERGAEKAAEDVWRIIRDAGFFSALEPSTALVQSNRERDQAREALAPFAAAADAYDPDEGDGRDVAWAHDFTIASLRRARAVLSSLPPSPSKEEGE